MPNLLALPPISQAPCALSPVRPTISGHKTRTKCSVRSSASRRLSHISHSVVYDMHAISINGPYNGVHVRPLVPILRQMNVTMPAAALANKLPIKFSHDQICKCVLSLKWAVNVSCHDIIRQCASEACIFVNVTCLLWATNASHNIDFQIKYLSRYFSHCRRSPGRYADYVGHNISKRCIIEKIDERRNYCSKIGWQCWAHCENERKFSYIS